MEHFNQRVFRNRLQPVVLLSLINAANGSTCIHAPAHDHLLSPASAFNSLIYGTGEFLSSGREGYSAVLTACYLKVYGNKPNNCASHVHRREVVTYSKGHRRACPRLIWHQNFEI